MNNEHQEDGQPTDHLRRDDRDQRRAQAGRQRPCSIRPGRGLTFSIDLIEGLEIPDDDMAEMAGMFGGYLMDELNKAKALGIPIE